MAGGECTKRIEEGHRTSFVLPIIGGGDLLHFCEHQVRIVNV
jgi:hypothetical protein